MAVAPKHFKMQLCKHSEGLTFCLLRKLNIFPETSQNQIFHDCLLGKLFLFYSSAPGAVMYSFFSEQTCLLSQLASLRNKARRKLRVLCGYITKRSKNRHSVNSIASKFIFSSQKCLLSVLGLQIMVLYVQIPDDKTQNKKSRQTRIYQETN